MRVNILPKHISPTATPEDADFVRDMLAEHGWRFDPSVDEWHFRSLAQREVFMLDFDGCCATLEAMKIEERAGR